MLVSPAEPEPLRKLGTVSSVTEKYGADFIILSPLFGRVGVQRKEIRDLVASLHDGRVEREIWQQKGLDQAIWLIEGNLQWTQDGQSLLSETRLTYTKTNHLGVILSLLSNGCWVLNSASLQDSIVLLSSLNRWLMKKKHTSLLRRPSASRQIAGDLTDQRIHVMQGFNGFGYEKAKAVVEYFKGLPFVMLVDLTEVAGVGPRLDKAVREVLGD